MLEDVRRLRLQELKQTLEKLQMRHAAMYDEVNALNGQIWVLRYAEKQVQNYQNHKHHFWERFTKRKEFLAYRANLATLQGCPEKLEMLNQRLSQAENQAAHQITHSGILQKIQNVEEQIKSVKQATTLAELDMTPSAAVTMLKQHGIKPAWEQGDFEIYAQMHDSDDEKEVALAKTIDHEPVRPRLHKCTISYGLRENRSDLENF